MYEHLEDPKKSKSKATANSVSQKKTDASQGLKIVDNRPEVIAQRKINKVDNGITLIQRVPVSNSNMEILFPGGKKGKEWFFWGAGGYHVGAIRENDGSGDVNEFHVKKQFKGGLTNRIDWTAAGETYNEEDPPTILEYDNEDALKTMRTLGTQTKNLLIKWKK